MQAASEIIINFKLDDLIWVAPAIIVFLSSLVPVTLKILRNNQEPSTTASLVYALIGLVGAMVISAAFYTQELKTEYFANALVLDGLSAFSTLMISIITALTLVFAKEHFATSVRQFSEFVFLLLNSAVGMMIVTWSNDLIVTFIGVEIMSLCLYLLIALSFEQKLSKEAAVKYFVLGGFASAIFLYGVAFIFGAAQTTYINQLMAMAEELVAVNYIFLIGIVLTVLGFCFKVAIAPFHAWMPDVYEGASTPVTAFMAAGVKLVTFVAFLRFIAGEYLMSELSGQFVLILQWLAVFTMIVGNVTAILQNNLKRMLAYSSIAHSGYVLIAIICSAIGGSNFLGASGALFYLMSYAVMTIGAFGILTLLEKQHDSILLVDDLSGLAKRNPWAAFCFALFLLSLAGIPPTAGFFAKFFVFSAAIKQGLYWLVVWGVLASAVSIYYYLRPIVYMYMRDEVGNASVSPHYKLSPIVVGLSALFVVFAGLSGVDAVYHFITGAF